EGLLRVEVLEDLFQLVVLYLRLQRGNQRLGLLSGLGAEVGDLRHLELVDVVTGEDSSDCPDRLSVLEAREAP
ncbi:hypothetical protein PMAYCL1PPCAC_05808, partial [Pristionchus mayeri]